MTTKTETINTKTRSNERCSRETPKSHRIWRWKLVTGWEQIIACDLYRLWLSPYPSKQTSLPTLVAYLNF